MIRQDHPVCKTFEDCSTGTPIGHWRGCVRCYGAKGYAVLIFQNALIDYGFYLDQWCILDFGGDQGCRFVDVCDNSGEHVAKAVFTWFKVPAGKYNFAGHLI